MNFIDILVAVIIIWFAYKGFNKGLVVEITGLSAFLLGIYGGLKFSHIIAEQLTDNLNESYVPIISFSLTFIVIVVLVFLLGKTIEKVVDAASLKLVNKVAGTAFGGLKVAAIISIAFTIFEGYDRKLHFMNQEVKNNSLFYNPMLQLGDIVLPELERNSIVEENKINSNINVLDFIETE